MVNVSQEMKRSRELSLNGDQIIRGVAECIRASLRTGEQVYRILGDEYLLVNEIGGTVGF